VARVVVTPAAAEDLAQLITSHSLPRDTKQRVKSSLRPLARFPRLGAALGGRWEGFRFILGPWRWMIIVYVYNEDVDQVAVVTIQDGRSSQAPTAEARPG
jgi:plasmid stabilization system protein ParE